MRFTSSEGYSVINSSGLQHWFKNGQVLRKNKLTASTFAAAVGFFHRRRLQLWLEKIGAIEPFSGNLATCWSNIKEEEALERYKLITGNSVLFPEFQVYGNRNAGEDWLGASPDGVVDRLVYGLPSRGVLEIKCPFFHGNMKKATPWSRIPLYCVPQAQGLMEILDRDWMDFYVWTSKGSSLFRVYRDAEYWDVPKIVLSDFWWNHVQSAREIFRSHYCPHNKERTRDTWSLKIEGAFVQGLGFVALEELKGGDPARKWISPSCLYTYGPGSYKIPCINDVPFKFSVSLLKGHPNVKVIHSSKVLVRHQFSWQPPSFFPIKDAIKAAKSRSRV